MTSMLSILPVEVYGGLGKDSQASTGENLVTNALNVILGNMFSLYRY